MFVNTSPTRNLQSHSCSRDVSSLEYEFPICEILIQEKQRGGVVRELLNRPGGRGMSDHADTIAAVFTSGPLSLFSKCSMKTLTRHMAAYDQIPVMFIKVLKCHPKSTISQTPRMMNQLFFSFFFLRHALTGRRRRLTFSSVDTSKPANKAAVLLK